MCAFCSGSGSGEGTRLARRCCREASSDAATTKAAGEGVPPGSGAGCGSCGVRQALGRELGEDERRASRSTSGNRAASSSRRFSSRCSRCHQGSSETTGPPGTTWRGISKMSSGAASKRPHLFGGADAELPHPLPRLGICGKWARLNRGRGTGGGRPNITGERSSWATTETLSSTRSNSRRSSRSNSRRRWYNFDLPCNKSSSSPSCSKRVDFPLPCGGTMSGNKPCRAGTGPDMARKLRRQTRKI
mmetsp:Transcript_121856/g.351800  ORF Transcript_121856/g.351800 Transcript_121856/m.351800 type:complete len:246 (+) Transcript_121856:1050-1787(+)